MLLLIAAIACEEDRDFMTKFHNQYLNLLYYEAQKHIENQQDIEDVVYEAFVKIIEKLDVIKSLESKQQARYAVVTVRNLCYHHLRKQQKLSTVSFDDLTEEVDLTGDPEQIVHQKLFNEQIYSIMQELDLDDRMLLQQKYILYWTDEELAAMYGIRHDSMRMKLSRVKRKLVKLLHERRFPMDNGQN